MVSSANNDHQSINQSIAKLLDHQTPQPYTDKIELAWQALEALQNMGFGFTMASLGRNNFKIRIVKWAGGSNLETSTGEYIVTVVDKPIAFAICRAVVETIDYNKKYDEEFV